MYDVKQSQHKNTVVNCTEGQLKGLKISTSHGRDVDIADKLCDVTIKL